ncbi:DUF1531-domain-containing protein [Eremomyces bilateralis CBS 781.70]|uniref:DUF1531-domain-containing protein n=1 Tax=Eremomyces bilateralis CBS 781.70 TaxID=1392243 RepID=A0A6G1FS24_9PEZI|nr:DUF1531-domain-containing protein [Eremomyces bilateralis CBS 781.70]KAF1808655.1 DUF1531-domain-containing protein [Eremomyces bilateralis CBS 781.70]
MAQRLLEDLTRLASLLTTWAQNFKTNTASSFSRLRAKDYIRLIMVIGGYMLIVRPLLQKLGEKKQASEHERVDKETKEEAALMTANDLRRGSSRPIPIPGVDSDTDEEVDNTADWGKKARVRQRKIIRQKLEEHEQALKEHDSDKEIDQFLVD